MTLEALKYSEQGDKARLELLDQRRLPLESAYISIAGPQEGWHAIKDMAVRGAPAIAIAGALSLAVRLKDDGAGSQFSSAQEAERFVDEQLRYLVTSRPTAVNLADAAYKLGKVAKRAATTEAATGQSVTKAVTEACKDMLQADIAANTAMGKHGAEGIRKELQERNRPVGDGINLLTHCNTGSLATAGFGTALGVVRTLHQQGDVKHVYCTETRPYNQGSRLTAYELVHDGLPATLIADSAAASLMAAGRVDAIVVGADRVAANGDTANKIGTYSLAVNAAHHRISFYIAAPTTTLDPNIAKGTLIEIEQRDPKELTHHQGVQVAASGINVWNPSFDVTPAALITGIITERGLVPKPAPEAFDVTGFMTSKGLLQQSGEQPKAVNHVSSIPGFYALDLSTVKDYLADRPALGARVGPAESKSGWQVKEVGDGNINYVYIVEGPAGAVVVKQGLPYIRIAHHWPLTQERARIEASALTQEAKHCPEHVPLLYHYDPQLALIVMQYLPPPHDILRRALVAGRTFPKLSAHVATFLARTLFRTSLLALDSKTYREQVARFQNTELCRLTEQVIFTDPYYEAPVNSHTSPQLDALAEQFRADAEAKVAATRLKAIFCERQQALLHGDLHTGSFMVTEETTFAIDAEFACYGPIAFDVCKMIANLLIAFFAADGLATAEEPRHRQRQWLLQVLHVAGIKKAGNIITTSTKIMWMADTGVSQTVEEIWDKFRAEFTAMWTAAVAEGSVGDLNHPGIFPQEDAQGQSLKAFQDTFMTELFRDTLSFAGAVIIRRILGIAHVIDLESIKDPDTRAICETRALTAGRELLVNPGRFLTINAVTVFVDEARGKDGKQPYFSLKKD